jgi:hypothetical protein
MEAFWWKLSDRGLLIEALAPARAMIFTPKPRRVTKQETASHRAVAADRSSTTGRALP